MINAAERLSKRVRAAMGDHNNDDLPVTQCVINMRKEVVSLQSECEELRKDAERYRYIKKGNQWVVAATQTGYQLDGEDLDDLIDSEMEQQK